MHILISVPVCGLGDHTQVVLVTTHRCLGQTIRENSPSVALLVENDEVICDHLIVHKFSQLRDQYICRYTCPVDRDCGPPPAASAGQQQISAACNSTAGLLCPELTTTGIGNSGRLGCFCVDRVALPVS